MHKSLITISDFFLPRFCAGCNNKLRYDEKLVCNECLNSILVLGEERMQYEFDRKFRTEGIIKNFYSHYIFESDKALQNIIHALKYDSKFKIGVFLGEILAAGMKSLQWQIDMIVPVPIHHLKKAERGYNQSDFIVQGLSKSLKIPWSKKILRRIRYTQSQTQLNQKEREENVADAFKVKRKRNIKGKNLLLVDDVITTGVTIQECGKVLKSTGANTVYACSVAIAE